MPRYSEKQKAALDTLMRDDVYREAMEIIESDGLHALTLDRLAKGIGVARGTLYNYFADRDAIIDFLEERTFEPLMKRLETIAGEESSAFDKLETIFVEILDAVGDNLALVAALSPEKYSSRDKQCHDERRREGLGIFHRVVEEGTRDGEFRELPPAIVAEVLLGTISGLIDNMAYGGEFPAQEELVPVLKEMLTRGLKK